MLTREQSNRLFVASTSHLLRVMVLAQKGHKGQKYGEHDYFEFHILGVLSTLMTVDLFVKATESAKEAMMIVAIGHDLLEDTSLTALELRRLNFSEGVIGAIELLTRTPEVSKEQYIENIKQDNIARAVKIADTIFNLKQSVAIEDTRRINKYRAQLDRLTN